MRRVDEILAAYPSQDQQGQRYLLRGLETQPVGLDGAATQEFLWSLEGGAVGDLARLAEATLATSLKPAPEPMQTLFVDTETFQENGEVAEPIEGKPATEWVACGVPFEGHEVVAMNEAGEILGEGMEGELCHRGPSITAGYFNNPEAIVVALHPGTVETPLTRRFARGRYTATPAEAAAQLVEVLDGLSPADSGGFFAYDASVIPW